MGDVPPQPQYDAHAARHGVSGPRPWSAIAGLLVAAVLFAALGHWQLQRLVWKQALIARVAQATTASPLALTALPDVPAATLEYHRMVLTGRFEPASTTLVTATTELGSGYWDMAVLRGSAGAIWVNRGFVPIGSHRAGVAATTPTTPVTMTGLIRLTEPKGTWLRANHPGADRWYSRDLAAMAQVRHLTSGLMPSWVNWNAKSPTPPGRGDEPASPKPGMTQIFVDAQQELPRPPAGAPVPGLTVLDFPNNHLGYAVTWFALALLSAGGAFMLSRRPA